MMGRLLGAMGLVVALGCAGLGGNHDPGLEPLPGSSLDPAAFAAPEMVRVSPGDTLAGLAARHGVTPGDVARWNDLQTERLEPDQVLVIWPSAAAAPPPPSLSDVLPPPAVVDAPVGGADPGGTARDVVLAAGRGSDGRPEELAPPVAEPARVVAAPPATGSGAPPIPGTPAAPPPVPVARVAINRPAVANLLGLSTSDVDLEGMAAGMTRHDSEAGAGAADLGGRSLGNVTSAEELVVEAPPTRNLGPQIPDAPVRAPALTKPPAKACRGGSATELSEQGVTTSNGLSVGQINAAMAQISRHTVRCFPSGTSGSYQMIVEITAGCDGRVSNVHLVDAGVIPAPVASCVTQTLGYAAFPAHGVPNGVEFQYPMKFTF